jgi:hypothetical protein
VNAKVGPGCAVAVGVAGGGVAVGAAAVADGADVGLGSDVLVASGTVGGAVGDASTVAVAVEVAVLVAVGVAVGVNVASSGPSRLKSSTQTRESPAKVDLNSTAMRKAPAGALTSCEKGVQDAGGGSRACIGLRVITLPASLNQWNTA